MGFRGLWFDFGLLRQGLSIEHEFGAASLAELARVARFLERAFYEQGSFARSKVGFTFVLRNPPLRMGAFSEARLSIDGHRVDGDRVHVRFDGAQEVVRFDEISPSRPLVLPVGRRSRFSIEGVPVTAGEHTLRLELQSLAVPPLVWIEITEPISEGKDP